MMVRVWEYEIVAASTAEFEAAYGADGAWARLFGSAPGFMSSALYRSVDADDRYITVDLFASETAWRHFLRDHVDAYQQLDARTARLTLRERELVAADTPD
jgi:heme-degrading monooxygenase HmoA